MEDLFIEASKYTPAILFDYKNHLLEIKGESYPENIAEFYAPIFSWIEQYVEKLQDQKATINIDLIYFNSSSSKILLDLFDILESAAEEGKNIEVNWIYEEGDEDGLEFGEEFQEDFKAVSFNLVQKDIPSG